MKTVVRLFNTQHSDIRGKIFIKIFQDLPAGVAAEDSGNPKIRDLTKGMNSRIRSAGAVQVYRLSVKRFQNSLQLLLNRI